MTKSMNKFDFRKIAQALLVVIGMFFAMQFMTPIMAHATAPVSSNANDPNSVTVNVTSNGLQIGGSGFADTGAKAWTSFIGKYKAFIVGIAGMGAVTMIVLFIVQFLKLGASAGNPNARSQALGGVLWTGIAAAGLGAVTIIVGFFYNAVR